MGNKIGPATDGRGGIQTSLGARHSRLINAFLIYGKGGACRSSREARR
jgi:hypothetical protein